MTLTLAPVTAADAAALEARARPWPWSRELLEDELARPDRRYVGAYDGAELIGYAGVWSAPDETHLLVVAVDPAHRRRGIATRLLHEALPSGPVTLEVAADNASALALYRRLGFVTEGRRPAYYPDGQDALVLWRRTDPQT